MEILMYLIENTETIFLERRIRYKNLVSSQFLVFPTSCLKKKEKTKLDFF